MIKNATCLIIILFFEFTMQASHNRPRRLVDDTIVARLRTLQVQSDDSDLSLTVGDQGVQLFAKAFETRLAKLEKIMAHKKQENREIRRKHRQLAEIVESVRKKVDSNSRAFIGSFHFGPNIQQLQREYRQLDDRFRNLSGEFAHLLEAFKELAASVKKTES